MEKQIKLLTVVGARPNFMKAAPIIRAVQKHNEVAKGPSIKHLLVHTGQHFDAIMSDSFFTDLGLPHPDFHLGIGAGSQSSQTAEILRKFEDTLLRERPDVMIVVGDVSSTIACALAAIKLPLQSGELRPLIAHVEAGLRSFDREMPEEINRIVTDHLADLLFVTEKSGMRNLKKEGISDKKIHFVGNTMIDSLLTFKDKADDSKILEQLNLLSDVSGNGRPRPVQEYALLTLHRPANVDNREAFEEILKGLTPLSQKMPVIFPVHPRTRKRIEEFELKGLASTEAASNQPGVHLTTPLGYLDFVCMMKNARIVVTDSGGIQEETTCLGVPCVTLRENTERPVTVSEGTNILGGVKSRPIQNAVRRQLGKKFRAVSPEKWDGKAAKRIVAVLASAGAKRKHYKS